MQNKRVCEKQSCLWASWNNKEKKGTVENTADDSTTQGVKKKKELTFIIMSTLSVNLYNFPF